MKIIKRGNAHKRDMFEVKCPNCESEIRIIVGDPHASRLYYNVDSREYWVLYKCPVCQALQKGSTFENATYHGNYILTQEDREDIDNWPMAVVSTEEKEFFWK